MGDLHRLIVFDLDGTLIDSRRDLAESANQLIVELGGEPLPQNAITRMIGEGAAVLVRRALDAAGVRDTGTALPRFLDIYDKRLLQHTRAYSGIPEALRAARRHAPLAVLTNKPTDPSERILAALELRALFNEVVGGDGPWPRKPDPASLLALIQRTGATPATTLLVGDSPIDYETATRGAVRCCLAAWGFGYDSFPAERIGGADWVARQPGELVAIVDRFAAGRS